MFSLTTHSTHFSYCYMASDIWLRTILIVSHIGYSYRLTARVLLYAPSHRQDNTYHGLCYTSRGALAGTRNSSMGCVCVCVFVLLFILNTNTTGMQRDLNNTFCFSLVYTLTNTHDIHVVPVFTTPGVRGATD